VVKRREDLTSPRANRRIGVQYDSDAFGAFSLSYSPLGRPQPDGNHRDSDG